jgi:RNA polymerase sigma factor FliA
VSNTRKLVANIPLSVFPFSILVAPAVLSIGRAQSRPVAKGKAAMRSEVLSPVIFSKSPAVRSLARSNLTSTRKVLPSEIVLLPIEHPQNATILKRVTAINSVAALGSILPGIPSGSEAIELARRNAVVLENLRLVKSIASRVHVTVPGTVEMDDLIHAGMVGLIDAATRYDPKRNVAFSTYAKHRIHGTIIDSLRKLDWASRDMRRRSKLVEAATQEVTGELQRFPTEHEIAAKLGIDVSRLRIMMLDLRNVGLMSASTRGSEDENLPAPEFASSAKGQPDAIYGRNELHNVLEIARGKLPLRYQTVVTLYYANDMTMKDIGRILGINESRVSQIHRSSMEKLAAALGVQGITSRLAF